MSTGNRCEFMEYHIAHDYRNDGGDPRRCDGLYPPPTPTTLVTRLAALADEWDERMRREFSLKPPLTDQYSDSHSRELRAILAPTAPPQEQTGAES